MVSGLELGSRTSQQAVWSLAQRPCGADSERCAATVACAIAVGERRQGLLVLLDPDLELLPAPN
jgi:hypothetical protein